MYQLRTAARGQTQSGSVRRLVIFYGRHNSRTSFSGHYSRLSLFLSTTQVLRQDEPPPLQYEHAEVFGALQDFSFTADWPQPSYSQFVPLFDFPFRLRVMYLRQRHSLVRTQPTKDELGTSIGKLVHGGMTTFSLTGEQYATGIQF